MISDKLFGQFHFEQIPNICVKGLLHLEIQAKYDLTEVVTEFGKFDHGPKKFGNQTTQTTLQLDEVLIVWKIQIECEKRFQIFFISPLVVEDSHFD